MKSNRANQFRRIRWMLCVFMLAFAGKAMAFDTPKTGDLKDGEKCGKLPCTCGNASATAVGQVCHKDDNIGPASGTWTNEKTTNPVLPYGLLAVLLLVIAVLVIRRRNTTSDGQPAT